MRYFDILASIHYKRRCEHAAAGGVLGLMGQRVAVQDYQQGVQPAGARNQCTRDKSDCAHRTCMEAKDYKVG
ncbi:hypothetical protein [Candidatus Nitrospira neomarina]|uniref:Uncharacterized protein n=1 Tax=Candidatus Nitrospira neomarina TaxID=3020899 RepID=A0AA96GU32_9BACT|nr:hypothetical protein [Candidatus Nitrospira neomarina]WNM63581.1 hypothetical protein PQG83_07455 [Candidatus Nitrospira neomarina]